MRETQGTAAGEAIEGMLVGEGCSLAKMAFSGQSPTRRTCGNRREQSRRSMILKDEFSRLDWVFFLARKSDATVLMRRFLADIRNQGVPSIVDCVR